MQQMKTFALALALAAALPLSLDAQGRGKDKDKGAPGQKCRAEGGTSNSRACRDRYGENQKRDRDDRDTDSDRRRDRDVYDRRTGASTCRDSDRDGVCDWREDSRAGSGCVDRDRDGICDRRDNCIDRDRDGRCDRSSRNGDDGPWWGDIITGGRRTGSFPLMSLATRAAIGERSGDLRTYLGTGDLRVRNVDRDRDGRVESASWVNAAGQLVQVWQDRNEDGRADRVSLYQNGRLVRTVQ